MKTYLEFVSDVKHNILDEDVCPSFDDFMDWMHTIVETADDPEAKIYGSCYREFDEMHFADRHMSCWRFFEGMARLFGYVESHYMEKHWPSKKRWRYVPD